MATKRVIELDERTTLDMGDFLLVDAQTGTRKLAFTTLLNYLTLSSIAFVTELPTTDIQTNVIYFVPHSGSLTLWDEYVYRDDVWVNIAQSEIDFSNIYQTKTDNTLTTTSKQIVGAINEVNNDLTDKIDGSFYGVEEKIGTWFGKNLYRKCYKVDETKSSTFVLDSTLNNTNIEPVSIEGCYYENGDNVFSPFRVFVSSAIVVARIPQLTNSGLQFRVETNSISKIKVILYYTKI